jgi:ketosteroid isomerase-like protein
MKRVTVFTFCLSAVALLHQPACASGIDEVKVSTLLGNYVKRIRFDDPNSAFELRSYYAIDAVQILSDGKLNRGREQILQGIKNGLEISAAALEDLSSHGKVVSLHVEGNTAFALMSLEVAGVLRNNGNRFEGQTWLTIVLQKRTLGWKIVQEQATVGSQRTISKEEVKPTAN